MNSRTTSLVSSTTEIYERKPAINIHEAFIISRVEVAIKNTLLGWTKIENTHIYSTVPFETKNVLAAVNNFTTVSRFLRKGIAER